MVINVVKNTGLFIRETNVTYPKLYGSANPRRTLEEAAIVRHTVYIGLYVSALRPLGFSNFLDAILRNGKRPLTRRNV